MTAPEPYYQDDFVTIYHGDCYEIAPTIEGVDALIADPPYGMSNDCNYKRFTDKREASTDKTSSIDWQTSIVGDSHPFDPSDWLGYRSVVLWGSNHFCSRLPVGTTLVWLKRGDAGFGTFLSDAEVAWSKGGHGVYVHRDTSMSGSTPERMHPTAKPVGLMRWVIDRTTSPGDLILDPFMGSGPIARAAKDLGRKYVGIEIEQQYVDAAVARCRQEVLL